jgi:hypothetical protein
MHRNLNDILRSWIRLLDSEHTFSKIENPKPFPTHKGLANAVW